MDVASKDKNNGSLKQDDKYTKKKEKKKKMESFLTGVRKRLFKVKKAKLF